MWELEFYDNETVVKALEKYQEFCDKGYFPEGFLTQDPNDTLIAMANGQCAMDIQGQWQDGKILQEGLDIADYGVFPFPSGETNRMSVRQGDGEFQGLGHGSVVLY